jgi:hypothetical protein
MAPAIGSSTIRSIPFNPLDAIIHNAGRKLSGLMMTKLYNVASPSKSEAQSLVRDLLDIARIVDQAILEIGREARSHFGNDVDLDHFIDPLLTAMEGNATFTICQAAEQIEEYRADAWRDYSMEAAE